MQKKIILILLLPILLSACSIDRTNQDRLRLLSIEECAEERAGNSAFGGDKSSQLIRKECEQMLVLNENYQRMSNRSYSKSAKLTYPENQKYFNENTWRLVTDRIRERHYPQYLAPEEEVARAMALNEKQAQIGDKSVLRVYEPRLLPVSPFLMNWWELGKADDSISDLMYENRDNKQLYGSLAVLRTIVIEERIKKERSGH
ncbi:MAG: hypothetical protein Q7U98_05500 [Methylicorpusculum sp.]|uniref:hypothetical protein n=1 Tax=Methylicorpusculum sp. TaxID=2713644 RepID=UPI00271F1294|nr:hypothetical protein [Methylicorpusculum sp.]MDO8938594.1 hypothetical protein [Methylicorpusculum sp.]